MEKMTVVSKNGLSYEQLELDARERVDRKVEELRKISSSELLTYGIESQTKVTRYANEMLTKITPSEKVESIDSIIEEVLDVSKPIMGKTAKRGLLKRIFGGKDDGSKVDRSLFAGKIDKLVVTIDEQIGRLISDNIMYDDFIELLVENVNSISETIIALERFIDEVEARSMNADSIENTDVQDMSIALRSAENNNLLEQLRRRLNMFKISKQESMQVAVSARVIQSNNVTLSDRLQTLLVVAVPILQNQVLLKASLADTQRGLDICDKVAESIDSAMKQNAEQLKGLTSRLGEDDGMPLDGQSVASLSRDIISIAEELRSVNKKAREDLSNMESQIQQSEAELSELFSRISTKGKEE